MAAAPVYGRLTLGLVRGILQLALLVAGAWWYEDRSTRFGDSLEPSRAAPSAAPAGGR
ncbi:hypothetical protein [Streptomyces sp. NPDC008122]|uniref:hypothetical protein n=1 Tax=Streptomyces sp. NPDC008122 TaxID=3364810 RepID=UPI0036E04DF1